MGGAEDNLSARHSPMTSNNFSALIWAQQFHARGPRVGEKG